MGYQNRRSGTPTVYTRRSFITHCTLGGISLSATASCQSTHPVTELETSTEPFFKIRGFTVWAEDLARWNWPQKAHAAGMNTIATHHDPEEIIAYLNSEKGQVFLEDCNRLGIDIEHSLHSYSTLLPRQLFSTDPDLFRMNKDGERTPDANFCVSSKQALEIVTENAVKYAHLLEPTTGRHLYISDDAKHLCSCPKCKGFSASDQTLIVQNGILNALRYENPEATISHPAYVHTLEPPREIMPEPGVFLEWAPITRTHSRPYTDRDAKKGEHGRLVDLLHANLEIFGAENAQVFEYWFDSYRASGWKTKEERWVKAPWYPEVLQEDLAFLKKVGIRNITSVTCWINQDYVDRFGEPPLLEYGHELLSWECPISSS